MSLASNSADIASRSSTTRALQDELGRLIDWATLGRLGFDAATGCFAPDRR